MIKKYNTEFDNRYVYYTTYFDNTICFYKPTSRILYKERFINNRLFCFNIKIKTK